MCGLSTTFLPAVTATVFFMWPPTQSSGSGASVSGGSSNGRGRETAGASQHHPACRGPPHARNRPPDGRSAGRARETGPRSPASRRRASSLSVQSGSSERLPLVATTAPADRCRAAGRAAGVYGSSAPIHGFPGRWTGRAREWTRHPFASARAAPPPAGARARSGRRRRSASGRRLPAAPRPPAVRRARETSPPAVFLRDASGGATRAPPPHWRRRPSDESRRDPFTATIRPAPRASAAIVIAASRPASGRPGGIQQFDLRSADRAGVGLGMVAPVGRIIVLAPAVGAHVKAGHGRVRPVVAAVRAGSSSAARSSCS